MDQYASQFLMRGGIGPSQADGNPALPEVVVPQCLSAGYQGFGAYLGQQRPKRWFAAITPDGFYPNIYICGSFCIR